METDEGRYIGSVIDGRITGEGCMFYKSGDFYEGYWLDGAHHGKGKYTWASGDTYAGTYKLNLKHGRGIHTRVGEDGDWAYIYDGEYVENVRHGQGSLREIRPPVDYEGVRYIEFTGYFENDMFHGKGRLLVFESKTKLIKFEEHDGLFKYNVKDGLGRQVKLKDSEMYGDEEEFRKEVLTAATLDYQEFIGDFINDRPVYHSGVLKNTKVAVDHAAQMTKLQA
jgi:hypothetical protein